MATRQFFTTHHWWGKILGAFFGFLVGNSVGAFLGILIGNLFDRGLAENLSRTHWQYHKEKRKHVQKIFFTATFAVMGHVAKADGRISTQEIAVAKKMMHQMRLSAKQKETAKRAFNAGKQPSFNLINTLNELVQNCRDNPDLIRLFIDIQYQAAMIEPLTEEKIQALNTILSQLGFAPLQGQYRFYKDFMGNPFGYSSQDYSEAGQNQQRQQKHNYQSSHQNHQHYYQQTTSASALSHAYTILNVSPTHNKQEIKRAYRRLISRNHPDKLIAQGLPEEMIKMANFKTQQITKAYQQICESKGW
jgi:DnaJ like chaperone protein